MGSVKGVAYPRLLRNKNLCSGIPLKGFSNQLNPLNFKALKYKNFNLTTLLKLKCRI